MCLIIVDLSLSFCWTKNCLDNFIEIFEIPISFLSLTFVSIGVTLAYYRTELNYEQNQLNYTQNKRQIEEFTRTNYHSFRNEFIELVNEKGYQYKFIDLESSQLFNKLYPESRDGNYKLSQDFEHFIFDSSLYGLLLSWTSYTKQ